MQRIFNIEKWTRIPAGKAISLIGDRPRRVQVEVNAPVPVKLLLVKGTETRFLALVCGRDTIEFYCDQTVGIAADGDCYVYTVDGERWEYRDVDPESFTVVKERRERNYELELIAAKMAENMNRRMEQQANEIRASMARRFDALATQPAPQGVAPGSREPAVDRAKAGAAKPPRKGGGGDDDRGGTSDPPV